MNINEDTFANKYPTITIALGGDVNKVIKSATPKVCEILDMLFTFGWARTAKITGRGRWSTLDDRSFCVTKILDDYGHLISYYKFKILGVKEEI